MNEVNWKDMQSGDQVRAPASSPLAGGVLTVDYIYTCVGGVGGTGLDVHALSTPTSFVALEDVPLLTRVFPWVKLASVMPDALRLTPDGLGGTRLEVREGHLSHLSPKCWVPPDTGPWITVGVSAAPDGEGEATFSERGGPLMEAALMRGAVARGCVPSRGDERFGPSLWVLYLVPFRSTAREDHTARGLATCGATALARALLQVAEENTGVRVSRESWPDSYFYAGDLSGIRGYVEDDPQWGTAVGSISADVIQQSIENQRKAQVDDDGV